MGASQRILVVENDLQLLERLCEQLESNGFHCTGASLGSEGLNLSANWPMNLVLTEARLPDMSGMALARAIYARDPRVRFLLLSGTGEAEKEADPPGDVPIVLVRKPLSIEDLVQRIRSELGMIESPANRREHHRYLSNVECQCILINPFDDSESRPIAALMRDISRSGVATLVRQLVPVPAMIRLVINLPNMRTPMTMLGKSVSCTLTQIRGLYRMGAKFIGLLPPELEEVLAQFGVPTMEAQEDIYMGKSFKEAANEWLDQHPQEAAADTLFFKHSPPTNGHRARAPQNGQQH